MNDEEKVKRLLEKELVHLWSDLYMHLRTSANGYWSGGVEGCLRRILIISKAIGITPWEKIQYPILSSGVYAAICKKIGTLVPMMDSDVSDKPYPSEWAFTIDNIERYDLEDDEL